MARGGRVAPRGRDHRLERPAVRIGCGACSLSIYHRRLQLIFFSLLHVGKKSYMAATNVE
jgi:hypothetical protein